MNDTNINDINAANVNFGTQTYNGNVYYIIIQSNAGSPQIPTAPLRVFLSYARADDGPDYDDPDKSLMRRLANDLASAKFAVWWDRISMPSRSLPFSAEIEQGIRDSDRFVLVVGPNTKASDWVQAELRFALELCKPIAVVLRAGDYDGIPDGVKDIGALDFRPPRQYSNALTDLIARLNQDAPLGHTWDAKPLPRQHLLRSKPFDQARAAICADAVQLTVISAPPRAVSVYGHGGVGKSTLASALAHDCTIRRTFPDGIIWLKVGQKPVPNALQASVGATVFGDSLDNYRTEQDGRLALAYVLRDRKALIVLDDVWDYKIVEQFPVDGTACRLLVTTRSSALADKIDGADIRLDVLTPEEGAALIARHAGGSETDPIYIQIAQTLGGHTLAIVLSGRQLANHYADNAADLLGLLTKGDNLFAHLKLSEDDKNENLELSLSLSYDGLSDDLMRPFRFTGVLALESTFDRAMLAALWGDSDSDDARAPINTLVDAGLLERADDGRLYQHRLLRAYAHALLVEKGELDAAFGAYADYVIAQCAQFNTLPPEEWFVLDPLLPHVREVGDTLVTLYTASNAPDETLVQRAGDFAYTVADYVSRRPQITDTPMGPKRLGLDWLEMGLNVSRKTQDQKREAFFCNEIGSAWDDLGEKRKALAYYEQALELARAVGEWGGEASTLNNIGLAWDALGEKRTALEYYEQALPLRLAVGDRGGEATTLNNIGLAWNDLGEQRKALEYFQQALPLRRAVGDRGGEATTLNNIGGAWSALGEQRKALEYYEQALPMFRAVGDRGGEANTLNNIGGAWNDLGEKRKALEYYERALPLRRAVGDRGGEATTLNNIGLAWSALGEKRKALEYYEQALPLRRGVEDRAGEAVTCFNIAMVHRDLGDLDQAVRYLERCVQLDEEVEHPDLESDRQMLERVRRERDGETAEQGSQEDQAAEVIRQLAQLFAEKGEDAVREMLKGQAPDAVIEQLIKQLAQAGNRQPAQSTLPPDAVQVLAGNSVAVMTGVPEKREEWRNALQTQREAWSVQGDRWQIEVEFADALLAVLDNQPVQIASDSPYASVVRQVLDQIESYGKEDNDE